MKTSVTSFFSPSSVLSSFSPQPAAATAAPSTPNKRPKQVPVDSEDRAKRRRGEDNIKTLDDKSIEEFRAQIYQAYYACFSMFCDASKMTPDFLLGAFDNYVDSSASLVTDDSFDPGDLSIILLAIERGLPIFVDNPSMKKQIHKLARILAKDAQIVSFSDLKSSDLTREGILNYCRKCLDANQIWGMSFYNVLGVADTGFISAFSNNGVIDKTLESAFISPKFVEKELARETAKLTIQARSITTADIEQQVREDLKVLKFISKSDLEKDILTLSAQPMPNENILRSFTLLKAVINLKLNAICPTTAGNMATLIKKCITYRSIMENYTCSAPEIDYLYEVHKIISGDAVIARNQFEYKDFLAAITTIQGLESAIDSFIIANSRKITNMQSLDAPLLDIKLLKSAESYNENKQIKKMTVFCNGVFGPLYNVHRSLKADKIQPANNVKMHMDFYQHLFKLLDRDEFNRYEKNKKIKNVANQKLTNLTNQLSEIFKEIDVATKAARSPMAAASTKLIAKFDACSLSAQQGDNLNPPGSSSSAAIIQHDPRAALSSGSFGFDMTNTPPVTNINKKLLSPGKENRSAMASSAT